MKQQIKFLFILCSLILSFSCIEEVNIISETEFVSVMVIEATITDELKHQEIKLSRSYTLDEDGPLEVSGATVTIIGSDGANFGFQQDSDGVYRSISEFAALSNVEYHLEVTSEGRSYRSSNTSIVAQSQIEDLYMERDLNENLEEGVSVYIDALNLDNSPQLFRFEYEETYKIIAPTYSQFGLIVQNDDFPYQPEIIAGLNPVEKVEFFVTKELKEEQERICFNTVASNEIMIADSEDFQSNNLIGHRIRFIGRFNYIMSHRYSILVKQFTQSSEAHKFYKTLKQFSESESLFSQIQPGFLQGNLITTSNETESVAGFFEVSSVDSRRIYFNYTDLFPGEDLPPYYRPCNATQIPRLFVADPLTGVIGNSPLQTEIKEGNKFYFNNFDGLEVDVTNFFMPYVLTVFPSCGDCTVIGETIVPDFWEE